MTAGETMSVTQDVKIPLLCGESVAGTAQRVLSVPLQYRNAWR